MHGTKRVGANVALLFAHKKRTAGWYGNDFVVDVYVMDIEKRKTYKMQGDELSYKKTIAAALNRLLSDSSLTQRHLPEHVGVNRPGIPGDSNL